MLPNSRSRQLSTMPQGAKGSVVVWANRPVGVPSYPEPPRHSAVRRPAPTRPWYTQVWDSTNEPRMNRLSTAGFIPPSVYIGFPLFVLPETRPGGCSSIVRKVRVTVVSWADRPVGIPSCPFPARPAVPPCAAPSRRARGISGFWIRQI